MSFGLSEVAGGDAVTVLKSFTDTVDDLCDVLGDKKGKVENYAKFITSIKTTMSDLGPVNPLFNSQLKSLREKLLPAGVENLSDLSDPERSAMGEIANFFL